MTPLAHVQALLAADAELPAVHPHVYRGDPREPALVLVGLGGEGLVGVGIRARRNIDSVRIEARAPSMMAAEALLERSITVLQRGSTRLVAAAGTATDYDPATEIYRVFGTVDIRRS